MAKSVLRLTNLTKFFGRFKALDALNLEIQEGEVFTLLGPSGCGKTTTLRLIAGLESPDDGEIVFGDRTVVSVRSGVFVPPHKRHLGMVFQSYAIWPHMTVFENVAFPMKVRRIKGSEIRERSMRALDMVGLEGLENRGATQLSGGQQQRVALARALVYEPSMLLLDEPFSNLDAQLRKQMRVQLKLLLKRLKITTVFVTHDQIEALSLSDRIALMKWGRVEQIDTPQRLYEQPGTPFVRDFLGSTVLFKATVGSGIAPDRVCVHLAGLSEFPLNAPCSSESDLIAGSDVFVAIRPEDVEVLPPGTQHAESSCLPATVESLLFVGDRYECRVRLCNDETVLLHTPRSTALREGDEVSLRVAEESISIWPV